MREFFRKMIRNQLIMAIISIIFGIILIAFQGRAVAEVIKIIGYILVIAGIVYLLTYFFGKENKKNPSTLASSILCFLFGFIFIAAPQWLIAFFPTLMGIILVVSSIFNLSAAISAPVRGGLTVASVLFSLATLVLGIVAIADPVAIADFLIVFIGVTFLINGISDLIAISMLGKKQ